MRRWTGVLALVAALAGCASTTSTSNDGAALILTTGRYELHYRNGKVYLVSHGTDDQAAVRRQIDSYIEFRGLYGVKKKKDGLPPAEPERGVEVDVLPGLECVHRGVICGSQQGRYSAGDAVKLRLLFPR